MDEKIVTSVVGSDKAETFFSVKPLNRTLTHTKQYLFREWRQTHVALEDYIDLLVLFKCHRRLFSPNRPLAIPYRAKIPMNAPPTPLRFSCQHETTTLADLARQYRRGHQVEALPIFHVLVLEIGTQDHLVVVQLAFNFAWINKFGIESLDDEFRRGHSGFLSFLDLADFED